jgi:RimJ/RimL family protein N-acetyltransferase
MPPLAPRPLEPDDAAALDRLLARHPFAGAYARSHLAYGGFSPTGVRGIGSPAPNGDLSAALVAHDVIGWAVWDAPDQAPALAAGMAGLDMDLLSGLRPLIAPVVAALDRPTNGDHCPFEAVTPAALRPPPGDGPAARAATPADMEALIDFYIRGFYSLAHLPTRAAWRTRLSEQLAHRLLYIIEEGGQVVAAALSSAQTPDAALIGGVATLDTARGRGLATRCVHALCVALFAQGITGIGLFYLPTNTPAARVYSKLGFVPSGEWWLERVGW